jgi:hypothetical protein
MSDVPLAPCLLCHATTSLTVQAARDPFFGTAAVPEGVSPAGWAVRCTACALRGPWRATAAAARQVWNVQVAPKTIDKE